MKEFYTFTLVDGEGKSFETAQFEGKVVLVVNTATGCGFTPQYEEIEKMYEKYHDQGFEVLDVPCNQFRNQAPGTDEEIRDFCQLKYHTKFPQMQKSDVNGENALPLFEYLKSQQGFQGFGSGIKAKMMDTMLKMADRNYKENPDIKWNFTKFLVNREGDVVARFEPTASMKDVEKAVCELV